MLNRDKIKIEESLTNVVRRQITLQTSLFVMVKYIFKFNPLLNIAELVYGLKYFIY